MLGNTGIVTRIDVWVAGLFLLIFLLYGLAFTRQPIILAPFVIIVLMLASKPDSITTTDLYQTRWFIILMSWTFLSAFWSIDRNFTIDALQNLLPKVALAIFSYKFLLRSGVPVYSLGITIVAIVSAFAAIIISTYGSIRLDYYDRMAVGGSYSNVISAALVTSIPIIIFNTTRNRISISVPIILICILIVLISESRAGAGLGCLAIALSLSFYKSFGAIKWISSLLVMLFLSVISYAIIQVEFPELAERFSTVGDSMSLLMHSDLWRLSVDSADFQRNLQVLFTIDQIMRVPLLGVGYGAFGAALEGATGIYVGSHSLFGTFFVELGLIGFVLFVILNATLAVSLFRNGQNVHHAREARNARMAFVGLLVATLFFVNRPQMYEITYFIMLGFAMAAARPIPKGAPATGHGTHFAYGGARRVQRSGP